MLFWPISVHLRDRGHRTSVQVAAAASQMLLIYFLSFFKFWAKILLFCSFTPFSKLFSMSIVLHYPKPSITIISPLCPLYHYYLRFNTIWQLTHWKYSYHCITALNYLHLKRDMYLFKISVFNYSYLIWLFNRINVSLDIYIYVEKYVICNFLNNNNLYRTVMVTRLKSVMIAS